MNNIVHLVDCMEFMKDLPDNAYDLAIIDPPYRDENQPTQDMRRNGSMGTMAGRPNAAYWHEIRRVSRERIIWGANNFQLPQFMGFVVWRKRKIPENFTMSMAEIAALSSGLSSLSKVIEIAPQGTTSDPRIHPTQKPVDLYKWLLKNYAKPGQTIFDSHVGSGSIRIACHDLGFNFTGCEIDKDYWEAQEARYQTHAAQGRLFDPEDIAVEYSQCEL